MGHCVLADGKRKRRYPEALHRLSYTGSHPTTQAGDHSDGGGDAPRLFIKAILVISAPEFGAGGVRSFFGDSIIII